PRSAAATPLLGPPGASWSAGPAHAKAARDDWCRVRCHRWPRPAADRTDAHRPPPMGTTHDEAIATGAQEKASILLVDDQPANLTALRAVLERPEYDIVSAHSGEEALAHVLKRTFAVILLDVAMPTMDGFEVARSIKQRPAS